MAVLPGGVRGRRVVGLMLAACLGLGACAFAQADRDDRDESDNKPPRVAVAGAKAGSDVVTVVAAGDIARRPEHGEGTARLIQSILPDAVLPLGDNAYEDGTVEQYKRNYDPTWGQFKAITRPVPGNHEYHSKDAAGYFEYFREQVRGAAYYAWDAGVWRMYALNCEIDCGKGSAQLEWLKADLATHPQQPALAYVHQPRFTCSTHHKPELDLSPIWVALQRGNGRILLGGHNHAYERFAKQDASGTRNPDGLRQFVVGTGGAGFYELLPTCANRQASNDTSAGVLRLDLGRRYYWWQFVSVDGRVLDEGRGSAL